MASRKCTTRNAEINGYEYEYKNAEICATNSFLTVHASIIGANNLQAYCKIQNVTVLYEQSS